MNVNHQAIQVPTAQFGNNTAANNPGVLAAILTKIQHLRNKVQILRNELDTMRQTSEGQLTAWAVSWAAQATQLTAQATRLAALERRRRRGSQAGDVSQLRSYISPRRVRHPASTSNTETLARHVAEED